VKYKLYHQDCTDILM